MRFLVIAFICAGSFLLGTARAVDELPLCAVSPPSLMLTGPGARHYLLVDEKLADGVVLDLTRTAKYLVADPRLVEVNDSGLVRAKADGSTTIKVEVRGKTISVPVVVRESQVARSFHFENDILPLLGRFNCNSSGCHGKAEGQNGFKLSVFGFDAAADFSALVKEGRGRRLFPAVPEKSLLLTKASGQAPHGGGLRIPAKSEAFETIRGWIAAGAPFGDASAPRIESIRMEPGDRIMPMHADQQLRVIARYSDGRETDVTTQARYQSNNDPVATVSAEGVVRTADIPGEAAIMAAFLNEVASFRLIVPRPGKAEFPKLAANNFIDPLVEAKLRKLNVTPSGSIDEYTFIRRVYLDIIGTLPTPDETRAFVKDPKADKRAKLVDALLERPEYAAYWALKWSDLLRVDRAALGHQRAYAYYRWILESFAANKPFDKFTRELITAEGPIEETPATNFFGVLKKPGEAASAVSQVFLGIRIACAECHHHPYDRWGQDDYYRMSAFFTPLSTKKIGTIEALVGTGSSSARNPRTNQTLSATPLGVKDSVDDTKGDQRKILAEWLVSPKNAWFSKNIANRYWAHFFGRGIIEPVDDTRATNPPSNPELLEALAKHLDEGNFDPKKLIRAIVLSRTYQTTVQSNETNIRDEQNYSRALARRPDAEVTLDMISQVLGVPEKFEGFPEGTRAIGLWDSKVRHYFLKTFGRPQRISSCECERNDEVNIAAVLHLLNSESITAKISNENGTVARLLRENADDAKVIDELFLLFLSRPPTDKEKEGLLAHVKKQDAGKRRVAFEDIAWALLNTKEFMFNR